MDFFKSQDIARKNTGRLVVFFSLAVLSLIVMTNLVVMLAFGYLNAGDLSSNTTIELFDWEIFFKVGVVVITVVALGSLYKIRALSGGGARVAEMMDGELIVDGSDDINKKKILNVVEEMAIASGTPVPPVYLINEHGINAFAAGYSPSDAVIGITRGAIETLSRDQLQGVVAHEFSHILNGDMRLNIRLIGILHGITVIGMIGYYMLRTSSRSRRSRNGGGLVGLGLGLMVIGYAGTFFGNLIKAGVSRQREYLADASAVQFTRSRDGIAGALKRIGGNTFGSVLTNPNCAEISHTLFCQGITGFFNSLFATHPPLEKRIRIIQPDWDGKYDATSAEDDYRHKDIGDGTIGYEGEVKGAAREAIITRKETMSTIAAVMTSNAILEQIGKPTVSHLDYASEIITGIPDALVKAVHEPYSVRAVIYFLVLDEDKEIRNKQLRHLESAADSGVYEETTRLINQVSGLRTEHRLPLVEMALSTLRQLTKPQYKLFKENLVTLIKADDRISLSEWAIQKIVFHHLDAVFGRKSVSIRQYKSLAQTRYSCSVLLSILVYSTTHNGLRQQDVFNNANLELGDIDVNFLVKNKLDLDKLNKALNDLVQLKPLVKPRLLKACAACITADKQVSPVEAELFRAISDTLDCPMPPLLIQ